MSYNKYLTHYDNPAIIYSKEVSASLYSTSYTWMGTSAQKIAENLGAVARFKR